MKIKPNPYNNLQILVNNSLIRRVKQKEVLGTPRSELSFQLVQRLRKSIRLGH